MSPITFKVLLNMSGPSLASLLLASYYILVTDAHKFFLLCPRRKYTFILFSSGLLSKLVFLARVASIAVAIFFFKFFTTSSSCRKGHFFPSPGGVEASIYYWELVHSSFFWKRDAVITRAARSKFSCFHLLIPFCRLLSLPLICGGLSPWAYQFTKHFRNSKVFLYILFIIHHSFWVEFVDCYNNWNRICWHFEFNNSKKENESEQVIFINTLAWFWSNWVESLLYIPLYTMSWNPLALMLSTNFGRPNPIFSVIWQHAQQEHEEPSLI